MNKQIIIVFLILIFALAVLRCRNTEKFVENKIMLPLNAYIIKNMDMTVQGKEISNWITKENVRGIISSAGQPTIKISEFSFSLNLERRYIAPTPMEVIKL